MPCSLLTNPDPSLSSLTWSDDVTRSGSQNPMYVKKKGEIFIRPFDVSKTFWNCSKSKVQQIPRRYRGAEVFLNRSGLRARSIWKLFRIFTESGIKSVTETSDDLYWQYWKSKQSSNGNFQIHLSQSLGDFRKTSAPLYRSEICSTFDSKQLQNVLRQLNGRKNISPFF